MTFKHLLHRLTTSSSTCTVPYCIPKCAIFHGSPTEPLIGWKLMHLEINTSLMRLGNHCTAQNTTNVEPNNYGTHHKKGWCHSNYSHKCAFDAEQLHCKLEGFFHGSESYFQRKESFLQRILGLYEHMLLVISRSFICGSSGVSCRSSRVLFRSSGILLMVQ